MFIKVNEFEYSESNIVDILARMGDHIRRYDAMVPNCYTQPDNEADLFTIRKSGFCDEFEVKTSRSDFLNDSRKKVMFRNPTTEEWRLPGVNKGELAAWEKWKQDALIDGNLTCNYFWYVIKEGIVTPEEVPEFAGLIEIKPDGRPRVIRSPKKLHNRKLTGDQKYFLIRKLAYRYWDYRIGKRI